MVAELRSEGRVGSSWLRRVGWKKPGRPERGRREDWGRGRGEREEAIEKQRKRDRYEQKTERKKDRSNENVRERDRLEGVKVCNLGI